MEQSDAENVYGWQREDAADSEYSSDSSDDLDINNAGHQQANRQADHSYVREPTNPQFYKFAASTDIRARQKTGVWRAESEGVEKQHLRDFVKYSRYDLLTISWHLASIDYKTRTHAPFFPLPVMPEVLQGLSVDAGDVAKFMCLSSNELYRRHEKLSPETLRSLPVRAAADISAACRSQISEAPKVFDDSSLNPKWEADVSSDDDSEDEGDGDVKELDFCIAMTSMTSSQCIEIRSIKLLNGLVNRCIKSSRFFTLHCWGISRITQSLLRIIGKEMQKPSPDEKLVAMSLTLAYKLSVGSCNMNAVLALLRWSFHNRSCAERILLPDAGALFDMLNSLNSSRVKLLIPKGASRGQVISVVHSLNSSNQVRGLCAVQEKKCSYCVMLTDSGVMKIELRPPFSVVLENSHYTKDVCCGMFVEGSNIAVIGESGVDFLSIDTLEVVRFTQSPVTPDNVFSLYVGENTFKTPYFSCGRSGKKHPYFNGNTVSGTVECTAPLLITRGSDSLSVQFFILPEYSFSSSELTLLALKEGDRNWLTVTIVGGISGTIKVVFKHGFDCVAEIDETVDSGWLLISATMSSVNDTATWTTYCNGVQCSARGQSGSLVKPSGGLTLTLLSGTFRGFISSLQVWDKAQHIGDMRLVASGGESSSWCSFQMNEEAGISLHCRQCGAMWRGNSLLWKSSPKELPARSSVSVIPWKPRGAYYILTNQFEIAVIENDVTTWIALDGSVVDQQESFFRASDLCFYCPYNANLLMMCHESLCIRYVITGGPATSLIRDLPTVISAEVVTQSSVDGVSAVDVALFVTRHLNSLVLFGDHGNSERSLDVLSRVRTVSLKTIGRLLSVCQEIVDGCGDRSVHSLDVLILCFTGRLLIRQVKLMERRCPSKVVPQVDAVLRFIQEAKETNGGVLDEAESIFSELHKVVLAESVSHDYQMNLIVASADFAEVEQLLTQENLPALVSAVIRKDMKKSFMSYLHRLRDACGTEATELLSGKPHSFDASNVMLTTLTGMLQNCRSYWALVAVALLNSISENILRIFEHHLLGSDDRASSLQLLKQTAIGVVVYPLAHYFLDMVLDQSVAADVLKLLHGMFKVFSLWTASPQVGGKPSTQHSLVETYSLVTSPQSHSAHAASIDLKHAKGIRVDVSFCEPPVGEVLLVASLICGDLRRLSKKVECGQTVSFDCGGELTISSTNGKGYPSLSIVIHAEVELVIETELDWLSDICCCLRRAIITGGYASLLSAGEVQPASSIRRDSIHRAGLTNAALSDQKCDSLVVDYGALPTAHSQLLALAEGDDTCTLTTTWKEVYRGKNIPNSTSLECVVKWCACAIAWHCTKHHVATVTDLKEELSVALDHIKRRLFLLLEARQLGKEDAIVARARYLLVNIHSRQFMEAQLSAANPTEEPVDTRQPWATTRSANHSSRRAHFSSGAWSRRHESMDLSTSANRLGSSSASMRSTFQRNQSAITAVSMFKKGIETADPLPNQLTTFLFTSEDTPDDLQLALLQRTRRAADTVETFRLLAELAKSCVSGKHDDLSLLLDSYLQYRVALATSSGSAEQEKAAFNSHYTDHLVGCGLLRELELQQSVCGFVQAALRAVLHQLLHPPELPLVECLQLCAVLCHPWDSVDISLLRPSDMFLFLQHCLSSAFAMRIDRMEKSDREATYVERKGLFDLALRCLVMPNSVLPISTENARVVDGDVQGIHVEHGTVVCVTRNQWKPLNGWEQLPAPLQDGDAYANFGLPCIVSQLPDVQYFEITIDLVVRDPLDAAIGISELPLPTTGLGDGTNAIWFGADGRARFPGGSDVWLSEPWQVEDVIGCGVFAPHNSVFFTRNGVFLGIVTRCSYAVLSPFIKITTTKSVVRVIVNFGREPFKLDLATLHCSCRYKFMTSSVVSDAVVTTVCYLLSMCHRNFMSSEPMAIVHRDAISSLLEHAATFLSSSILELLNILNVKLADPAHPPSDITEEAALEQQRDEQEVKVSLTVMLSRLFHCLRVAIECLHYDAVTPATHSEMLQLCAYVMVHSREVHLKLQAAKCLILMRELMSPESLLRATERLDLFVSAERVVETLVELAHINIFAEDECKVTLARWSDDTTIVRGKNSFFGATPMPSTGTHTVGFRFKRAMVRTSGKGSNLGGCYYVGLCSGQPRITNMQSVLSRNDIFVLQDCDDKDQVEHLELRRNAIPLNLRGRIYGHDEVVWVEYNADLGEITFFRENVCLGVGFRNVLLGEDLYPMVFSFNDDATCEIVEAPGKTEESLVKWISKLHRSTAIHALQHLHLVPFFAPIIQRMITRSIAGLEQQFTECLIGLATLGSERSYMYCQHSAYGLVVVEMVSDVTGLAVVYIADDPSKHFFTIEPNKLTPYFVCPPIYAERVPVAHSCAKLLTHTLQHSLVDASFFSPLTLEEEERRAAIEEEYHSSLDELSTLDLLSLLHATHQGTPRTQDMPLASDDFVRAQASVANSILQRTPVIVEPKYSTKTIFSPHPSIGVATAPGPTIIRGNALEMSGREELTFAVSLPRTGDHGDLLYVGITTSTSRYPDQQLSEVAHWEDTWALCSKDSSSTNNTHCCVEPTMIFNGEETLFSAQDVLLLRLHSEGSLEFSRLRGGRREDFGVLFENIPLHHAVMDSDEEEDEEAVVFRPFIACGEGTYAVWSFMDAFIFPARMTVSPSSLDNLVEGSVQCGVCGSPLGTSWYVNHRTTLCNSCFIMWQQPLETFCRMDPQDASMSLRYLVSPHKPKELLLGHYVEFEESPMLSWSPEKSVNMTTMGGCCLATRDECIAVTESFSSTGQTRVDLLLHYVAGAAGFPFGGLLPFSPLWRQGGNTTSHIDLAANDVRVSTSVIPPGTKAFFTLQIREVADTTSVGESTEIRDLFLGLTNNTSVSAAAEQTVGSGCRSTVERLRMEGSLWGLWCDKIISPDGRILVLIDTLHGRLSLSSSMVGLRHAPTVLTFSVNPGEPLHILLSSSEACRLTAWEGFISGEERTVPSFVPIAVGLLPDDFDSWSGNALEGAVLLADTVAHTKAMSPTPWVFAEGVTPSQSLFRMGDPITLIQDGAEVRCYCRGLPIASTTLSPCQVASRHRVVVSLSVQGLCATVVPPLWGRARVGRIQRVCSPEVCLVECPLEEEEKREKKMVARGPRLIPVRRRNVRYCVVAATYAPSFPEGLPVVYKIRWMPPKRGVLASVQPHCFGVQDVHCVVSVQPECCFIADNEDCTASVQAERPSVVPPRDTVSRIFEVGKLRYRMQGKRSFNGIMFDCRANTPITLTGLLIMSQTAGRHRVDVFYKKDSHIGFEHNANAWTIIYSGDVDMNPDTFYPVIFPPVGIEAMSSFALYLNTSHNCGVGFYADEDSCTGAVGTELDTDGVLTVYMGKPSSSSNDFMDISTPARGFLGTILYEHHSTAPVPAPSPSTGPALTAPIRSSMGALSSSSSSGRRGNTASLPLRGERFILSSRPLRTATAPSISFEMEVLPPSLHLSALSLPILLPPTTGGPVGVQHALLSVSLASGSVKGGAGGKGSPAWVWRSRELLTHPTTAVQLPLDLCLRQGRYILSATVHPIRSEDEEGTEPSSPQDIPLMLHAVDGVSFCRRNHVVAVYGFVGDLRLEMEALPVSSLLRTMTTGATLNQGNAASYNGIMFDLCSKVELTIERMLFVSQTSADMVLVRLYWKEGSMRGAENSPTEWREVTASYINLVDRQHYSPGPLSLHMKPGRRYSVYLNTTSSCGVRFFNSSDGFSQAVGEEFESDGILTLFVGKKCESSTPFAQIPDEARAFRGKVEYRTYTPHTDIPTNQAIFSCPSAFVVTRLLVALYAYVNATEDGVVSPEEDEEGGFAYRQLLDALAPLATAPLTRVEPALSMNAIENATFQLMDELSVNEEEDNCFSLSMRPRAEVGEAASTFSSGDLAILVEENLQDASLVRLCSDARPDGTIFVQTDKSEETIAVVERRLLPIARCLHCDGVYAAEPSSCPHHRPPATEEARIEAILSRRIANTFAVAPSEAAALATALFDGDSTSVRPAFTSVEELRALQRPEHREVVVVRRQSREHSRNTATEEKEEEAEIRFQVPSYLLLPEGVVGPEDGLLCPMAFHPTLQAAFSLYLRPHRDGVEMFFITDLPERWRKEETQRSSAGKVAVSREACFHLHPYLVMEDGVTTEPLSPTPFVFLASSAGRSLLFLLTCAPPYRGTSGTTIEIGLFITAAPLPAITSPAGTSSAPRWGWESGSVSEALSPRSPAFLDGTFGGEAWPRSKPRTCAFVAMCLDKKDTTLFLELVVVRASNTHGSSSSSKSVDCRARFNVLSGEVVSIFFAPDGDVLVYDADDVVRCHLSEREMRSAQQHRYRLGILCLEPTTRVVAQLDLPEPSFRGWRGTPTAEAGRRADAYIPSWQRHDPQHICISRQGLTARFLLDGRTLIGGQVVLGNPLPSTGVSAFIMQIDRRDRKPGTSLGSGHFAGIAVASFSRPAPSYGYFKGTVDQVWVVQDIQDSDSMPNQAELPPLHMEGSNPILFSAGTKLRFTVDRPRRTLSLARDDESPRVIFSDLPPDVVVCPFVRLDNSYSSATLSRCTPHALLPSSSSANRLDPHALPITRSHLRRRPLAVVMKLFPVMRALVQSLPSAHAARLLERWTDSHLYTRFDYRASTAMDRMIELGAFEAKMMSCDDEECAKFLQSPDMRLVLDSLVSPPTATMAVFPCLSAGQQRAYFELPAEYELLHRLPDANMARLLYLDPIKGPVERSLCLVEWGPTERTTLGLRPANEVLPHPGVVQERLVLRPLNDAHACAIVIDGWYDTTLEQLGRELRVHEAKKVASTIICALEHWHLHRQCHGHFHANNVLLRVVHGEVVASCLWRMHLGQTVTHLNPALLEGAPPHPRSLQKDLCDCAALLRTFPALLEQDAHMQQFTDFVVDGVSITDAIRESELLQNDPESEDSPTLSLQSGLNHRGGSGSYHGIMFDLVAKNVSVRITAIHFMSDYNGTATVRLYARRGTFLGAETDASQWHKVFEHDMQLSSTAETIVTGFPSVVIPSGDRAGFFLHTTNGSGVLFFSESDGIKAGTGQVESENADLGITVGKKSENSVPFSYIKADKRLLRGTIAYSLLMCGHAPRSSLVYSSKEVFDGRELPTPPPTPDPRVVPITWTRKEEAEALGSHTSESYALVLDGCEGDSLQLRIAEDLSFRMEPHRTAHVPPDNGVVQAWNAVEAAAFSTKLEGLRQRYQQSILAGCQPPNMERGEHEALRWMRSGADTSLADPLLGEGEWWRSTPLTTSSTISLWAGEGHKIHLRLRQSSAEGEEVLLDLGDAADHVWFLDLELGCIMFPDGDSVQHPSGCLRFRCLPGTGPVSVEIRLADSSREHPRHANIKIPLWSYVLAQPPLPPRSVCAVLRACDPENLLWPRPVLHMEEPSSSPSSSCTTDVTTTTSFRSPFLVHVRSIGEGGSGGRRGSSASTPRGVSSAPSWKRVPWVSLSSSSSEVEVVGQVAQQTVFRLKPSQCRVVHPRVVDSDRSVVTLRLVFRRTHPIKLQLEAANFSLALPLYAMCSVFEECFTESDMMDVMVQLYFDLAGRSIMVHNLGSGAVCEVAFPGRECPTQLQLTANFHYPGSWVEVLSWWQSERPQEVSIGAQALRTACMALSLPSFTSNVSPTVGTILRHTYRPEETSQDGEAHSAAKMGGLMVGYARLLLESAILSHNQARRAANRSLHRYLACTSSSSSAKLAVVVFHELQNGSLELIAQSCAYLLRPPLLQSTAGVDASVHTIAAALDYPVVRQLLQHTVFGPSLTVSLIHTATVGTRGTRHTAMLCARKILSQEPIALPPQGLLIAHLAPLLRMVGGLCRRERLSSMVVQIGITMVADLIQRGHTDLCDARRGHLLTANIPYHTVVCTRRLIRAILADPPTPLPAALVRHSKAPLAISCAVTHIGSAGAYGLIPALCTYQELHAKKWVGTLSMEVELREARRGVVVVGWNSQRRSHRILELGNPQEVFASGFQSYFPTCGYYIMADGWLFLCNEGKRSDKRSGVSLLPGDRVRICCSIAESSVRLTVVRGRLPVISTNFHLDDGVGLPFFSAQHLPDVSSEFQQVVSTRTVNLQKMYADLMEDPTSMDVLPAQSFDFFTELNVFHRQLLAEKHIDLGANPDYRVPIHFIAPFPLLATCVEAGFGEDVGLQALVPYSRRLQLFDSVTAALAPMVNLEKEMEPLELFRILKNLCSTETEESIQAAVLQPFQKLTSRKGHVTIHPPRTNTAGMSPQQVFLRSVYGQVYVQLHQTPRDIFYASPIFQVKFAGFASTDAGGPYRDLLSQLATEIMSPHPSQQFQLNPLFAPCVRGEAAHIMPNATLLGSEQMCLALEFFGKLLASFFISTDVLAVKFPSIFWKLLLGERCTIKDLAALDANAVRHLDPAELMERTEEELEEFVPGISDMWSELLRNHSHGEMPAEEEDASLPPRTLAGASLLSARIVKGEILKFSQAMNYIRQGFDEVIALHTLQAFRWQKVELLICGTPKLSVEAFLGECDVELPDTTSTMFRSFLAAITDDDRGLLLRFTTGQSRLPIKTRMKVVHLDGINCLPTSATCFSTLRIPSYSTLDHMTERVLYAIRHCKAIDADGQPVENLMLDF